MIQQILNATILLDNISCKDNNEKNIRISQKNPLSPLITNIYLHKIDEFVKNKQKEIRNKSNFILLNKFSSQKYFLTTNTFANKLKFTKIAERSNQLKKNTIKKTQTEKKSQHISNNKIFPEFHYFRYADDLIFGIRGPKNLAIAIKKDITVFLKNDLYLELKLANLYHTKSSSILYLGFKIQIPNAKKTKILKLKKTIMLNKLRQKIKQKKDILANKWKSLIDCFLKKKMINQVNEILNNTAKKIDVDWAINQINKNTFIEKITEVAESMLKDVKQIDKKHSFLNVWNFVEQWRTEVLIYLKNCWFQKNSLKNTMGNTKLIEDHKKLLKNLNKMTKVDKTTFVKKIKIKQLKKNNSNIHLCNKNKKQDLKHQLYVCQEITVEKMRRWGMISSKSNKPIVKNTFLKYSEIQFIKKFKNKARGLLAYYRSISNFNWLKKQVNYHMRWSLLLTISCKHKKSLSEIIKLRNKNTKILIKKKKKFKEVVSFLKPNEIQNFSIGFKHAQSFTVDSFVFKHLLPKIFSFKIKYKKYKYKEFSNSIFKLHYLQLIYKRLTRNKTIKAI